MLSVCAALLALAAPAPAPDAPGDDGLAVRVAADGRPVAGAKVWAFQRVDGADPAAPGPVTTGPDGVARVPRSAFASDRVTGSLFARGPDGRVGGRSVLPGRTGTSPVEVDLRPAGNWGVRVAGPDNKPAAGVELVIRAFSGRDDPDRGGREFFGVPPAEREAYRRVTGADGAAAFAGVPAGSVASVRLLRPGLPELTGFVRTDAPLAVALPEPGAVRLAFRGADAAPTRGAAYSVTPARQRDRLDPSAGAPPRFAAAGVSGTLDGTPAVTVTGLPPGDYTLTVEGGGPRPVAVKDLSGLRIAVRAGETAEVPVDLEPLARVTGRVVDAATGAGIPGAKVSVSPPGPELRYDDGFPHAVVLTDAAGRYVTHAPAGRDVVVGPPSLGWTRMAEGYLNPEPKAGSPPVAPVKLTTGHAFPDIKLRKAATFTAVVVGADDKPVAAEVRTARIAFGSAETPDEFRAKADGLVSVPGLDPDDLIALRARRVGAVNVPEAVPTGGERQTVRVAAGNAFTLAGRVAGPGGKPVAGAKVAVHWMYRGVGKRSDMSTSRALETHTTGPDGRFRSSALWPGDEYWAVVTAPGFAAAETDHVRPAEAGTTHDDAVALAPTDLAVTGRVVDLAGRPVAGARVFQRGDGDKPTEARSGLDGRFTLAGYRAGPGFVFAEHPGHRLAFAPADPGGPAVTVTLRKLADAPAPPPDLAAHRAALDKLTRDVFAAMWKDRAKLGGFERTVFGHFARFDPAAARLASDEAERAGDKADYPGILRRAEADAKLPAVAKTDPAEAVALLADRRGRDGCLAALRLGRDLRAADPAKALIVAEDAVQRARALDMPDRALYLAEAGGLAARCGNAAGGKAVVLEAAALAEPLAADHGRAGLCRGYAAAELAAFDRPRAIKLLAAYPDPDDANRYLARAVDRVAAADPDAAEAMLKEFKPGRSFDRHEARLFVAYRLAAADPDRAARLAAAVEHAQYRALGRYRLARLVARTDKARAWKILDAAFAEYDRPGDDFDSSTFNGGRPALLAVGAAVGRELDYPDVSGAVARAILHRPVGDARFGGDPKRRADQTIKVAFALSFADPAAARRVLASVAPPVAFAKRAVAGQRGDLFALAFVTPEYAMAAVAPRLAAFRDGRSGLVELFDALCSADRPAAAGRWENLPQVNNEWEE